MYFNKDESEIKSLVTYYTITTSVYFPLLILTLFWTNGLYSAGKYQFNSVISIILLAEIFKYFSSAVYYKTHDVNLSKKYDDRNNSILKNFLTKSKIKEGFKNFIVVFIMVFIYSAVAVLYGAEVFSRYEETFMFSSLLSVLTIFPACINLGCQSVMSLVLGSKPINNLESLLHQNFYLSVLGAWLGAFVIPLDWDRPWQVWPIPCSLGAMIGYTFSHVVMLLKVNVGPKRKPKKHYYN